MTKTHTFVTAKGNKIEVASWGMVSINGEAHSQGKVEHNDQLGPYLQMYRTKAQISQADADAIKAMFAEHKAEADAEREAYFQSAEYTTDRVAAEMSRNHSKM